MTFIDSINKNTYDIVNFSTLFYITSFSQFNDPKTPIYQKSISEGTINLIESDFVSILASIYHIDRRLNELITQEYEIGNAINLHIANNYSDILIDFKNEENDIDTETLNKLLFAFGKDGTLKYLIKSRLNLAKVRKKLLELSFKKVEINLKTYEHLSYD